MQDKKKVDSVLLERMAEILKAISNPIRLDVLSVLESEEPLTVGDIQKKISTTIEQSTLSHNLIKLKDKGILSSEKSGKFILYRIKDRRIMKIFDCMENCKDLLGL